MATFNSETKIWEGPKVEYDFAPDTSVGTELLKKLAETPERILHICHDDRISMTCEETRIASIRVAQNLTKLGFKKGDVFGFINSNSSKLPATIYGSLYIGAPINPLDVAFKKDDIKHIFGQTKPKLVFCDADFYEKVKMALSELENDATIITFHEKIDGVMNIQELFKETGNEDNFL
jgi:4-coumarate--CoA ligase